MPLTLYNLKPSSGAIKRRKRVGRGNASGHGTYSGRGQKGQRARSGGRKGLKLKGMRRRLLQIPKKRGFRSLYPKLAVVNVGALENKFPAGAEIAPAILKQRGLIEKDKIRVKILGDGALTKNFIIKHCAVSKSAKEKIEKAGGKVI